MTTVEHPLVVLTPRPWKWLKVLASSVVFVAIGVGMLDRGATGWDRFMAWASILFFGLGVVVSLIQLIPGTSRVVATSNGLHVKTFVRNIRYDWDDIASFGVSEWTQWHGPFRQRHRQVGIRFKEGSAVRKKWATSTRMAAAWTGYHGALPDTYGYKHQELVNLLNGFLEASRKG